MGVHELDDYSLKLLGYWACPFSRRVQIALEIKGLNQYDYIEQDLNFKSDELLMYNPILKKVPVLVHGDKSVAESRVIIEYIDEKWRSGSPILPRAPLARAKARFWAKFIDEQCLPSLWKAYWGQEDEQEQAAKEARNHLKALENELEGKRFFGGESLGFLDIIANFIGFWLGAIEEAAKKSIVTQEDFPLLHKWQEEFIKSAFVQARLPPRHTLVAFYRIRMEAAKALKETNI